MEEEAAAVKVFAMTSFRAGLTSAPNRLIWQGIAACLQTMFDLISDSVAVFGSDFYG